jgi:uncharacterized iron-regulated protein
MKNLVVLGAALALLSASCSTFEFVPRDARLLEAGSGREVDVQEAARELARYDVVFLGELHDSAEGHVLMTELTTALLADHPAPVLSLEMFERDVQDLVTAYVDGRLSREEFLAASRPWGDYDVHYGPIVDRARELGWDVIAANCPRPAARAIARGEHTPATASVFASSDLDVGPSRYREEFDAVMGEMGGGHDMTGMLDALYGAQVLKDETMAESIARVFAHDGGRWARVVHWNGRFHSDHGLGTVERLARRMPHLSIAVVTMERGSGATDLARSPDVPGLYVIQVP